MTTKTKTLGDELREIDAIESYGFADTGDGAISVELPAGEQAAALQLLQAGKRHGYRLVLVDGNPDVDAQEATEWRLEVMT